MNFSPIPHNNVPTVIICLITMFLSQGSRDDLSVSVGLAGQVTHVLRHGNSMDASFSKEVLNSITGIVMLLDCVRPVFHRLLPY